MIFDIGPFRLYRVANNGTLCISLICMDDWESLPCGWQWGWRDDARGEDKPWIELRVGKLMVMYVDPFEGGVEIWVLGFWAFPTWGKRKI